MGWTGIYNKPSNVKEFITKEALTGTFVSGGTYEPVAVAKVGNVIYAAVKFVGKGNDTCYESNEDGSYVVGFVVLTSTHKGEFLWKDMDESVGPNEVACPLYILDMLSPLKDVPATAWAKKWRENVRAYHAQKKTLKTPKVGQKIKFETPIRFSNSKTLDTFKVVKVPRRNYMKTLYESADGYLYSISNAASRPFTILEG